MTYFEEYLIQSQSLDRQFVRGEISQAELIKRQNLLKINMFFPKIAQILACDLEEQKRIDEEFGFMGGNYDN